MAHYDCSNCGESRGVAWGFCPHCTPQCVLEIKDRLQQARESAKFTWLSQNREARKKFVDDAVSRLQTAHDKLVEEHKPK